MNRLASNRGIAIGPILFVIAILGVLAAAMSASMGSFGSAGVSDRITADVVSQVNLIRTKIGECNLRYGANSAAYPVAASAILVSTATCPGDTSGMQNLWTGARPTMYPPPSMGMNAWYYINAGDSGGRCIYSAPTNANNNAAINAGLQLASTKFSSQEVSYQSASTTQKFVIFITPPTGSVNAACAVP